MADNDVGQSTYDDSLRILYRRFPVKLFEVRDRATFIPVMATCLLVRHPTCRLKTQPTTEKPTVIGGYVNDNDEEYLLRRAGYAQEQITDHSNQFPPYVMLARLVSGSVGATYDPYDWGNHTLTTAHQYIIENWNNLVSGQVIDVEFILGETTEPKKSERETAPL